MAGREIDGDFLALPLRSLADAALGRAREFGASHADFRVERIRSQILRLRNENLETAIDGGDVGFAVRVVHDGTWGFAGGFDMTTDAAARVAELAVEVARVCRPTNTEPVELADEPVHGDVTWVSAYDVDPFSVPEHDKEELLREYSSRLLASDGVHLTDATVMAVLENKFYADVAGTTTTQQRVRVGPAFTAVNVDRTSGAFETMRTIAPP